MTAVDFCQAPASSAGAAKPLAPNDTKMIEFTCTACNECFATALDQRTHFKSERHVYNTKRKQAGLKAISQEAWERKLRESRAAGAELKGTAHLKANKPTRKASGYEGSVDAPSSEDSALVPEPPPSPRKCLFDRKHFPSVELNLAYMEKTYSFFVPDQEYCLSVEELLLHLHQKVTGDLHMCINCNRRFPDSQSVRRHMMDKGHTQLSSEVHTRRGNFSKILTNELQAELEPFYDFHGSMREVSDKIVDPKQKIASILRFFDKDKDQKLGPLEVAELWAAASDGGKLSEAQYLGACSKCEADPKDGFDIEALGKLYESGLADLSEHWKMLQDLLVKTKAKPLKTVMEGDEDEDEPDIDEKDSDGEGDEDGDSESGSEDEVVECEDEDEFEEVMRILGLEPVSVTDTGDLRLPNGNVATHRDVSYIYRQRGTREGQGQLAVQGGGFKSQKRATLMLSNVGAGSIKMAVSRRQEARQGKMIIAVLKQKNFYEMKLGMSMNVVNASKKHKIRTGRGDMSNGR